MSVLLRVLSFKAKVEVFILVDKLRLLPQMCIIFLGMPVLCFVELFFRLLHGILDTMRTFELEFSLRLFTEYISLSAICTDGL